jgi:hypothetical protein
VRCALGAGALARARDVGRAVRGRRAAACSALICAHFARGSACGRYTALTFVPRNLCEQFGMHMNRYFLLIACLQLVRSITPVHPASTWGPLLFIFAISGACGT